jgi:hypothetical protein
MEATDSLTVEQQLQKLQARWQKIAGAGINSPKWCPPSELQWRSWLRRLPFTILYEDCLRRLHAFRGSIQADASSYLSMIVAKNGPQFMKDRGLSRLVSCFR